ncbi:MAG: hypothetical protein R3F34_14400 [Planctomycetota bacterium]
MPKLIVRDGGTTRAFRLTKEGRLTIGSGSSNKLVLASGGVSDQHAVLVVREEAASLDALAPVEIDGQKFSGSGLALPEGSKVKLGEAELELQADAAEEKKAAPAAAKSAARTAAPARAGAGARSSARSGSARSSRTAPKDEGEGSKRERPARASDRLRQKSDKPKWMMPAIIGGAVILVVALVTISSGGGALENLRAAEGYLEGGDLASARQLFDKIPAGKVPAKIVNEYNEFAEKLGDAENEARVGPRRSKATKYADKYLVNYPDKYLTATHLEKDAESLRNAKMRLWLQKFDEFEERFPDYQSPDWMKNATYAAMVNGLLAKREEYRQFADSTRKPTEADVEWVLFYYTDPTAKKGRRFDIARAAVERYSASGGSAQQVEAWKTLIDERARAWTAETLNTAKKFYAQGVEQGGENNTQYAKAADALIDVALVSGLEKESNEALGILGSFPNLTEILLGYAKSADEGNDSHEEILQFLMQTAVAPKVQEAKRKWEERKAADAADAQG